MTEPQSVRCHASVDRPYESVKASLRRLPLAGAMATGHVRSVCDQRGCAGLPPFTRVALGWETAGAGADLPVTCAEIYASAISPSETRLEIEGHCPLRAVGGEAGGGCVAEARLRALLADIVDQIRHDIEP